MKKKILFSALLLMMAVTAILFSSFRYYQGQPFYYAFKEKIFLRTVPNKYVIRFEDGSVAKGKLTGFEKQGLLKAEGWKDDRTAVASFQKSDHGAIISSLNSHKEVKTVQPLYETEAEKLEAAPTDEILIRFNKDVSAALIESVLKRNKLSLKQKGEVFDIYTIEKVGNTLAVANAIMESGMAEFSHPNFYRPIELHQVPNDGYFASQWNLLNTGQVINDGHTGTPGADIKATTAWPISMGSSTVTVAVLDEGVTSDHFDLPNTRQIRLNGSNFSTSIPGNDPSPVTNGNHGNACAGIVAATRDNLQGIAGVAPNCKIMPIKILNPAASDANIANSITFAKNNGAHVLSNSWGYGTSNSNYIPAVVTAIQDAVTNGRGGKGCVVVFAAGNTANQVSSTAGYVTFPGNVNIAGVLTVGASDRYDRQANYSPTSNPASTNNQIVDIVAPSHKAYPSQIAGENFEIWSMDMPGIAGYNPQSGGIYLPASGTNYQAYTGRMGGTSAACPQVAGAAALLLSLNPLLTQQQVFNILTQNADKVGGYTYNGSGFSNQMGYGRLNLYRSVLQAGADLYMQDQTTDTGIEPNPSTTLPYYLSQDVWVRNSLDGGTVHQNPRSGVTNYVYVKVRNRGVLASASTGNFLKVYWAKASTGLSWTYPWTGASYYCPATATSLPIGGVIGSQTIASVSAGGFTTLVYSWVPPPPSTYSKCFGGDSAHFCLLARIETRATNPFGMAFAETPDLGGNVRSNNNIVWKNISVVEMPYGSKFTRTSFIITGSKFLRRTFTTTDLRFTIPQERGNNNILDAAYVDIDLGVFADPWLKAGGKLEGGEVYKDNNGRILVRAYGTTATLYGIPINPDQLGYVTIQLTTKTFSPDLTFLFDLQQLAEKTFIGGERFDIRFVKEATNTIVSSPPVDAATEVQAGRMALKVYQSGGQLLIQKMDGKQYEVHIVNSIGQVMNTLNMINRTAVPVSTYKRGMYLVTLIDKKENKKQTGKVMIQ